MLDQFFKRMFLFKPAGGGAKGLPARRRSGLKSGLKQAGIFFLLLAFLLTSVPFSATVAEGAGGSDPIYIGFTSDVHGNTGNLTTWLNNCGAPTLDQMIFGGDYPERMKEDSSWTIAQQCVNIVKAAYDNDTPCVLVMGNHDTSFSDNFHKGLVYDEDDYAVYAMDLFSMGMTWSFIESDISNLAEELEGIETTKPVFVASHLPIHYFNSGSYWGEREVGKADDLLAVLNQHENVIFLWGHNHTLSDIYYGDVMTKGFKIKTTSSGADKEINFTYLSHGSMLEGAEKDVYGLLATLQEVDEGIEVSFDYKNLSGTKVSGGVVTIEGDGTGVKKAALNSAITAAETNKASVVVSVDGSDVSQDEYWVTQTVYDAYGNAISTAQAVAGNNEATQQQVDAALAALTAATTTFNNAKQAGTKPVSTAYQLVNGFEDGETYVIVAESGSNSYALTNTVASSNYLAATQVTVQEDTLVASGDMDAMLWEAEVDQGFTYLKNNNGYLQRVSGGDNIRASSSTKPPQGNAGWVYDDSESKFYTISTNPDAPTPDFFLLYENSSKNYFRIGYEGTNTIVKLHKLTQGAPVVDKAALNSAITAAEANLNSAEVSVDGSDVSQDKYWVTQTVCDAYGNATSTAQAVAGNSEATQQQVDAALAALTAATATFNNAKQAGTKPVSTAYQLVNGFEDGETYVIVAESGSNSYALTNTVASSNFLAATSVTIQDEEIVVDDVTDTMLWTAEEATKYMYLKNDNGYLQRESGPDGKLNASSSIPGEGYGEWIYDNDESKLYTKSTSSQGSGSEFVLLYKSGNPGYFKAEYQGKNTNVKLYKLIGSTLPTQYTLTLEGTNITSVPAAGLIDENTSVTIEVAPATGQRVASFTVNGEDKKADLANNEYTFTITEDTVVAVTYEVQNYTVTFDLTPADAVVEVKDSEGNVVTPETDGTYVLVPGDYTYTVTKNGYKPIAADFTVADQDETIAVGLEEIVTIASVSPVDNVEVGFGTDETAAKVALSQTTTILDSKNISHTVNLTWNIDNYNGNQAGVYTATGTFALPAGVDQADPPLELKVTATVTVKEELLLPSKVAISGPATIQIKLSGNATAAYTATVEDQHGNAMPAETVTWSLKETLEGISIAADTGTVTVADTTLADSFTIVAVSTTDNEVKAEKAVTLTEEKSDDATLSDLTVDGVTVAGFAANTLDYAVELVAGTTAVPTVAATATNSDASIDITQATALDDANNVATVKVTAADGTTTRTYTVVFTVAPNQDQPAPEGLNGIAPTSSADNNGKISGVTDAMEYKPVTGTEWAAVTAGATEITGLAAGSYQVRYAAKPGFNAGAAAEVTVPTYGVHIYTVTFNLIPADAVVEVKDSEGNIVTPETDGTYALGVGEYSYIATKTGYQPAEETFMVIDQDEVVNVVLEKVIVDGREELRRRVNEALALNEGDYTLNSWKALNSPLRIACTILNLEHASQASVNQALARLVTALKKLVKKPDKDALAAAINDAQNRNPADYTDRSWRQVSNMLTLAVRAFQNENASQADVDTATERLNNALNALVGK